MSFSDSEDLISLPPPLEHKGPHADGLGVLLFAFHLWVGLFVLLGWAVPVARFLVFYLAFLPALGVQWRLNEGSCVLNNVESWLRLGCWRDPASHEEGRFLAMTGEWLFGISPSKRQMDLLCHAVLAILWLAGITHLRILSG